MNSTSRFKALSRLGLAAGALYIAPSIMQMNQAHASGAITVATDPLTVTECGDCHVPYGPRYLRAYAWQKIMADLQNHYGEDASLDEATRLKIEEYLVYNGSRPRDIGIRITEKRWFVKEHGPRHIKQEDMAKAKTLANCTACHATRPQKTDRRPGSN